ncbi:glycosyltransferase family 2 protein [Pararhizobium haloflavum]|uniref:glycosyltransferase family 2 protein n=1 Tax=Pararhizobium haloflavum TaxID=2037914 RepID=UPI000C1974D6|nr:glycosyltransferase family 2 protein [Pararhizobium haloflavum]
MASVDIVIPCYNYGRYLTQAVESVLTQQGVDLRVLIIDNASEDDSRFIAAFLALKDQRVDVRLHDENCGATASYNEGVDWASADYFLILDADDVLVPGALKRAIDVLEADPGISFVHGIEGRIAQEEAFATTAVCVQAADVTAQRGADFIADLCRTPVNSIGANTVVRRTAAQKRVGHYRADLPYTDDLEMWLRLATVGDVACIKTVQALRRYHPVRMSTDYQGVECRDFVERERAFVSFFAHEGQVLPHIADLMAMARIGLGQHAYWSAISHIARGDQTTGRQLLALSRRWRRRSAFLPPIGWLWRMDRPVDRARDVLSLAWANLSIANLSRQS